MDNLTDLTNKINDLDAKSKSFQHTNEISLNNVGILFNSNKKYILTFVSLFIFMTWTKPNIVMSNVIRNNKIETAIDYSKTFIICLLFTLVIFGGMHLYSTYQNKQF